MQQWTIPLYLALAMLIYAAFVAAASFQLWRASPRPSALWSVLYIRRVARLRFLLRTSMWIASGGALMLLPLSFTGEGHQTIALQGGSDLLYAIALYGLSRWCERLIRRALSHFPKEAPSLR
jgi:hypothetical protein